MNTTTIFITITSIISCLGFIVISAMFASHLRDLLAALFSMFLHPLQSISVWFQRAGAAFKSGSLSELALDRDGKSFIEPIIGAVLFSVFSALFIYSDMVMICLTLAAWGHGEVEQALLEQDPILLMSISFIANAGFWGLVFCDIIGLTHCGPWQRAKGIWRHILLGASILCLTLSVVIAMAMGYWRVISEAEAAGVPVETAMETGGLSITGQETADLQTAPASLNTSFDSKYPATTFTESAGEIGIQRNTIQALCQTGMAGLTILSTVFSMCGLFPLLKCLMLVIAAGITACLAPIAFGTWLLHEMLSWLYTAVQKALDLCVAVGTSLLGLVGWSPAESAELPEAQHMQDEPAAAPTDQGIAEDANQAATDFNPLGWRW